MDAVVYFQIAGVAGDYFACGHYRASLAVTRCAAMYADAKRDPETPHTACRGCAIGARHAGESPADRPSSIYGRLFCCRCHRPTRRLLYGALCISCTNRQLEVARGRNAKGRPPSRVPRPHAAQVRVIAADAVAIRVFDRVVDMVESLYRVLRTEPRQVAFSRVRHLPPVPLAQSPLFDDLPFTCKPERRVRAPAPAVPASDQLPLF